MTQAPELKACPLCQSDAVLVPHVVIKRIRFRVECTNDGCGCKTASFSCEGQALDCWNTRPLEADNAALKAKNEALVEALQDVVDPLGKLRRDAEAEGRQLNGWAYQIANDLAFVKDIARAALAGVQ